MSLRIDTAEWITGALVIGETGLGVLAQNIPFAGDNGAGYAYNDLALPADNGKEICGRITSWPSAGTLFAYEDTSFTFTGAPDGLYSFAYTLFEDGVSKGSATVSLVVGSGSATMAVTGSATFTGSAASGGGAALAVTADATFSGDAGSGGAAAFAVGADAAFAGSATFGATPGGMAQIALSTEALFEGEGHVGVWAKINVTTDASFVGHAETVSGQLLGNVTTAAAFLGSAASGGKVSLNATATASFTGSGWPVGIGGELSGALMATADFAGEAHMDVISGGIATMALNGTTIFSGSATGVVTYGARKINSRSGRTSSYRTR